MYNSKKTNGYTQQSEYLYTCKIDLIEAKIQKKVIGQEIYQQNTIYFYIKLKFNLNHFFPRQKIFSLFQPRKNRGL